MKAPLDEAADRHCGFCGRVLREVRCDVLGCDTQQRGEADLTLNFTNAGVLPVVIKGLSWVSPVQAPGAEEAFAFEPDILLQPQQRDRHASARISLPSTPAALGNLLLTVHTTSPAQTQPFSLPITTPPRLCIIAEGPSLTHCALRRDDEDPASYKLICALKIDRGEARVQGLARLELANDDVVLPGKFVDGDDAPTLSAAQKCLVTFDIPTAVVENAGQSLRGLVAIDARNATATLRSDTIFIKTVHVPNLILKIGVNHFPRNGEDFQVVTGRTETIPLLLHNPADNEVEFVRVSLESPDTLREQRVHAQFTPSSLPLVAPARSAGKLAGDLIIDASGVEARKDITFGVRLLFELTTGHEVQKIIRLRVVPQRSAKEETLAIDFGNSHSVAATNHETQWTQSISLPVLFAHEELSEVDENRVPERTSIVRSDVLYRPLSPDGDPFKAQNLELVAIGNRIGDVLHTEKHAGLIEYFLSSFKSRLGNNENVSFPSAPNAKLTLEQALQDYMREFLAQVEGATATKHTRLVLTHPVHFWTGQKRVLETAVRKVLGNDVKVAFVDEATAAAAYFTVPEARRKESAYHECVLIFDFGGGTIDLTVCEIQWEGKQESTWHFRTWTSEGTSAFGGDAITQIISDLLYKRAKTLAEAAGKTLPYIDFLSSKKSLQRGDHLGLMNGYYIRSKAEALKLHHFGDDLQFGINEVNLRATWLNPKGPTETSLVLPIKLTEDELGEIEATIRERLSESMKLVRHVINLWQKKRDAGQDPNLAIEKVLMTGQASRLIIAQDMLKQVIDESFPPAQRPTVRVPAKQEDGGTTNASKAAHVELKECVAKGAVIYGRLLRGENAEVARCSRVYVFLVDEIASGRHRYIPVIDRLSPLTNQEDHDFNYRLLPDGRVRLVESFADLSADEMVAAKPDVDYRILFEGDISELGWPDEEVKRAKVGITYTEDEVRVRVIPINASGALEIERAVELKDWRGWNSLDGTP